MAIRAFKPTTPGQRGMTSQDTSEITTRKPLRSLLVSKRTQTGRNNQGRITTRHKGGGAQPDESEHRGLGAHRVPEVATWPRIYAQWRRGGREPAAKSAGHFAAKRLGFQRQPRGCPAARGSTRRVRSAAR